MADLADSIRACRACALSSRPTIIPVPFAGPVNPELLILAEAPGAHENERGEPLVGPSGKKARKWVESVGIEWESVARANVVSCYPAATPSDEEIIACHPNLVAQVELVAPSAVLVLGKVAFGTFWLSLPLSVARGHFWRESFGHVDTWCMATWHPAYALRRPGVDVQVARDLQVLKGGLARIRRGERPVSVGGCANCGGTDQVVPGEREMPFCHGCEPVEALVARHFGSFARVPIGQVS